MKVVPLILVLFVCLHSIESKRSLYVIPQPTIEVFRPRGLRVSIPDEHGISLFAFHGAANRELQYEEAGDMSEDILKKQNGRWVFEHRQLRLNIGDELNFWLYVIKNNLGYRLDDQNFIVAEKYDAPPGFLTIPKKEKTSPSTLHGAHKETTSSSIYSEHPPPPCNCPQQPIETPICTVLQSTTPVVLPENENWKELLANLTRENSQLHQQLSAVQYDRTYLVNKLKTSDNTNLNKLILSGISDHYDSLMIYVENILREKLDIDNFHIVKYAVKNQNNTITFELNTLEDKLLVLRKSQEKLTNSKFTIIDYL